MRGSDDKFKFRPLPEMSILQTNVLSQAVTFNHRAGKQGEELLLARNVQSRSNFYSTIAGFVEPGESIETAVHREVMEEVGIRIKNLKYFGSQSWPFPNSLMLGFHAEYEGGEIVLQEEEIADAQWFHFTRLPQRPTKVSISGWLIDDYLRRNA